MIYHDVIQKSDEWFDIRFGKATSSNFSKIMANDGKDFGNPALEYAEAVAIESVTHEKIETYFDVNMQNGIDLEPFARKAYEDYTFEPVKEVGFYESDCHRFGGSPDGILLDGGIEIKCVKYNTHFKRLKKKQYDTSHKWQLIGNIWLAELEWIDFVSYCPIFPENKRLFVERIYRNEDEITKLKTRLNDFWEIVEEHRNLLINQ